MKPQTPGPLLGRRPRIFYGWVIVFVAMVNGALYRGRAHAIGVAAASGGLQPLLRESWRWYLPGGNARRERFAAPLVAQLQSGLVTCARQAEELRYLQPSVSGPADDLVDAALATHDAAMRSDAAALEQAMAGLRPAADRLRAEVL